MGSIEPIETESIPVDDLRELIGRGWRVFEVDGVEFIVEVRKHRPPTIGRRALGSKLKAPDLPRATYSYETKGPYAGQKLPLIAWSYKRTTIQDFDDIEDAPDSLKDFNKVFGYVWTEKGLHVYQNGKQKLNPGHDADFERISRDNRGWYGDRIRSKDYTRARVLVTNDEDAAKAWLLAGGKVRLVNDVVRSYAISHSKRGVGRLKRIGKRK